MKTVNKMPVFFIGHGNPMNALYDNSFTRKLNELGRDLPRPRAILAISAHWMTEGTWITHMQDPRTIHDFYGFPDELFAIHYPAPGSPELARSISSKIAHPRITLDDEMWGLDHGSWALLRHMYPAHDVPVMQLSLNIERGPDYHFSLGEKLKFLREEGVLIMASGNIVHNLRRMNWTNGARPHDWAVRFDSWVKEKIDSRDFSALINDFNQTEDGRLSVPTPEHYYPMLYALGAADPEDQLQFEYEGIENSAISMRAFSWR